MKKNYIGLLWPGDSAFPQPVVEATSKRAAVNRLKDAAYSCIRACEWHATVRIFDENGMVVYRKKYKEVNGRIVECRRVS